MRDTIVHNRFIIPALAAALAIVVDASTSGFGGPAETVPQCACDSGVACEGIYRCPSIDATANDPLARAYDLIERGDYAAAAVILDAVSDDPKTTPEMRARIFQTRAHMAAEQEDYRGAIKAFNRSMLVRGADGTPALPDAERLSALYNIAQLLMVVEDYPAAVAALETWLQSGAEVTGTGLAMTATAHFQNRNYQRALDFIRKAIASTPEPKETWYDLEMSALLETGAVAEAIARYNAKRGRGATPAEPCLTEYTLALRAKEAGLEFALAPGCPDVFSGAK